MYVHTFILVDQLAKAAAWNRDTTIAFNRIPLSTLYSEIEEEAKGKWQKNGKIVQRQQQQKSFSQTWKPGLNYEQT